MLSRGLAGFVAMSLAFGSAGTASAGNGTEAFVGGLLGSAIGTAITNQATKPRTVVQERKVYVREPTRRKVDPGIGAYQRQQNREVQTALNYFGYSAGVPDGVMGSNSRSAVMQYQASIGFAPTGVLMENEKAFLLSSYQRALVGGPQAGQIIAASGVRGLLMSYRQEQLGIPASPPVAAVAPPPVVVPAVTVAPAAPVVAPAVTVPAFAAATAAAPVPTFMPETAAASETLSGLCEQVAADVRAAKGPIGTMDLAFDDVDPMEILDEQFCVARARAIDEARSLIAEVKDFSAAEMRTQCEAFTPALTKFTDTLPGKDVAVARQEVRAFVDGTGTTAAAMAGMARICLGIGYSTDNAELALGSALVLDAVGEAPYGELVGFQVVNGYGVPSDCDCGLNWFDSALAAVKDGAAPLVPDSDGERLDVLSFAVQSLHAPDGAAAVQAAAPVAAPVPTFVSKP